MSTWTFSLYRCSVAAYPDHNTKRAGRHAWVGGPSQQDDHQSDAEHDRDADELQPNLQPPAAGDTAT